MNNKWEVMPRIKLETEDMRWDRIVKEKLNSFPATLYD